MRLEYPYALALLLAVPLVLWVRVRRDAIRQARLPFPAAADLRAVRPGPFVRLRFLPAALYAGGFALLALALARPQLLEQRLPLFAEGIDIVLVLDLSTSMNAADFQPRDRATVAKEVIGDFINGRKNDRIGLVVFAAEAFTQCPLTLDYKVIGDILGGLRTGVIKDGTAIGNAIAAALNRLRESEAKGRVIILVTDGDNNAGNISPEKAAEFAKELGVRIFTIQVGTGGKVPYPLGRQDLLGRPVYDLVPVRVNPELLRAIATTTGGAFYIATDKKALSENLRDILDRIEKSKFEELGAYEEKVEIYAYFLAAGLVLFALALALELTRLRRFP